jgi:hypothetical protein
MSKSLIFCSLLIFIVIGCASKSIEIVPTYTTPNLYSSWDCNQINNELLRLNSRVATLTGEQDRIYKNDQMYGWVGTFLLWPLYLFIKGDGAIASELAKVKGEYQALLQASSNNKCD